MKSSSGPSLWILGFRGPSIPGLLADAIRRGRIAGLILFRDNLGGSVEAMLGLRREIRSLAPRGAPFILMMDEEGGLISQTSHLRTPDGFEWPAAPTPRALGRIGDPAQCRFVGRLLGRRLRVLGIHVDLAPSLDLDTAGANPVIGSRSFGSEAEAVASLGSAFADGLAKVRVGACFKHYPGHGGTSLDSHLALPRMDPRERDRHEEPFRLALGGQRLQRSAGGRRGAPAALGARHSPAEATDAFRPWIMSAHIDWGDGLPASLSARTLDPLRRASPRNLRITDALDMGAVSIRDDAAARALMAGQDLLLVGRDWEQGLEAEEKLDAEMSRSAEIRSAWRRSQRRVLPVFEKLSRVGVLPFRSLLVGASPMGRDSAAPAGDSAALARLHRMAVRLSAPIDRLPEGDWIWIVPAGLSPYVLLEGWKPPRCARRICREVVWIPQSAPGEFLAGVARRLNEERRPILLATLFRGMPAESVRAQWNPVFRLPELRLVAHLLDEGWPAWDAGFGGRAAGGSDERRRGERRSVEPHPMVATTSGPSRDSLSGLAEALDLPAERWTLCPDGRFWGVEG